MYKRKSLMYKRLKHIHEQVIRKWMLLCSLEYDLIVLQYNKFILKLIEQQPIHIIMIDQNIL